MIGAVAVCLAPLGCQHVARVGNRQGAEPPATPPPALSYRSITRASTQPISRCLVPALRLGFRVVFLARLILAVIHATAAIPTAFVGQGTAGRVRRETERHRNGLGFESTWSSLVFATVYFRAHYHCLRASKIENQD